MHATMTSVAGTTTGSRTHQPMNCTRCGGWMVQERCMDVGESLGAIGSGDSGAFNVVTLSMRSSCGTVVCLPRHRWR